MTLDEAKQIVDRLSSVYLDLGEFRNEKATLDGSFTADELEAIAVLMRNRPE